MASFVPGQKVSTPDSSVEVTVSPQNQLRPGRHRFQLVVTDDSGNVSSPSVIDVIVQDQDKPTAILDGPATVGAGNSFTLSGSRSIDKPPGKIVKYEWTLLAN